MNKISLTISALILLSCSASDKLPLANGFGANPALPQPTSSLIPTINFAAAKGWSASGKPVAAEGALVTRFADNLQHPRWLYQLPNGDILVAETNSPKADSYEFSITGLITEWVMETVGAGVPSANRITLLRDTNADGVADFRSIFLQGLNSPFGMALVHDTFYVANADALVKFPYSSGQTTITAPAIKVANLPAGLNHHWTKNLLASQDGRKLYVSVGSNSNIAEHGLAVEKDRAAILVLDPVSGDYQVFASGLRNPNGMVWQPDTGELWTVVNERDGLGNNLVPDYLTSVQRDGFYGWPYRYFGHHIDKRVDQPNTPLLATTIAPDYALGAHTASLGLAWYADGLLPAQFKQGMIIGQHGSWNREPKSGYKVIFVPFSNGKPSGPPINVLSGFLDEQEDAYGRPVGVILDQHSALLVADDVGNIIWRVTANTQ